MNTSAVETTRLPEILGHEQLVMRAFNSLEDRSVKKTTDYLVRNDVIAGLKKLPVEELLNIINKKFYVLTLLSGQTRSRILNLISDHCEQDVKCIKQEGDMFTFYIPMNRFVTSPLQWRTFCAANKLMFVSFQ